MWVKTTSHRSRERLRAACNRAGTARPQPWFRRIPGWLRGHDEYYEIPDDLDVSGIPGVMVLHYPIPERERFRPITFATPC